MIDGEALGLRGVECIALHEERRIEEAPAAYKPIQTPSRASNAGPSTRRPTRISRARRQNHSGTATPAGHDSI